MVARKSHDDNDGANNRRMKGVLPAIIDGGVEPLASSTAGFPGELEIYTATFARLRGFVGWCLIVPVKQKLR